ncbi:MAG TPA: aromatic amino acid DMT transporter YddG [Phycisphaerae bacterium]|nr:aromatic amino acid DMT transporter YddG [Phycisphaerae bacterium]
MMRARYVSATFAGFGSILLWSSSVGLSRLVTEPLGPMTTGAVIYLLSGLLGCVVLLARSGTRRRLLSCSRRYMCGCGGLFVLYIVCLYASIGLATGRTQVLEVGVINYLWPGLTLAFSVPLLGKRPRAALPVGILMGFAGVALVLLPPDRLKPSLLWDNFRDNAWPYLLAMAAAVAWALYSNLLRRWTSQSDGGGVPVFILASGVVMAALSAALREQPAWGAVALWPIIVIALGPALLAYVFWEAAMRWGQVTLLASAAYLIPLLSLCVSCVVLAVKPGPALLGGTILVVGGAVLCNLSIRDRQPASEPSATPSDAVPQHTEC